MSGVVGAPKIKSRKEYERILRDYKALLQPLKSVIGIRPSGSYVSDIKKESFGDMDLIVTISADNKQAAKEEILSFLMETGETLPFVSEKYKGRKYYNSGEIITVCYKNAQIDNIIALDEVEAEFKSEFLNLPAERQGLLLGLVKTANPGFEAPEDYEYQFNLSSKELQLRLVEYHPGTVKEKTRTIVTRWTDWKKVMEIIPFWEDTFLDTLDRITKMDIRSRKRIKGIFGSMISVKSGEINTPKGNRKEWALEQVAELV